MKRTFVTLLACVAFGGSSQAAERPTAIPKDQRPGFDQIREADIRADIGFLASGALMGRMSLETGDDAAIQWIAGEFAKAGLTPINEAPGAAGYLQAVPLIEYRGNSAASTLVLSVGDASQRFTAPDLAGSFRDDVDLTAPVAFAGYGISAPGVGYDDYKNLDVRGKVVVVFEHEPQETDPASPFNGTGNTRHATNRVKALNAQRRGAVAMIVIAEPNRKHPSNIERVNRIGGSVTRSPSLPAQALVEDELRIPIVTVSDKLAAALLANSGATPQALQTAIDKDLTPQSRVIAGATVRLHLENVSRRRGMSYNVAGLIPGSDPTLAAETVIISGHHDHDGFANGGAAIWHGADDNASGTVGVIELARAFMANPTRPKRSILFVAFAAEERGLLGAYHMAAKPVRPLATTRAMLNFDMIGRNEAPSDQTTGLIEIPADTTNRLNLIGGTYSPDLRRVIVEANRAIGLDLDDRFDREYALNVFFRSDQFPFVLNDIPAFWVFTGFHPDYHQTTDTADRINYAKMTRILQLSYLSVWRLANDGKPPAFVRDPGARR